MARSVAILAHRLGGDDGIAAQAGHWANALCELGFAVRRVAGRFDDARDDDVVIDALEGRDDEQSDARELAIEEAIGAALDGCELAVIANVCSIPAPARVACVTARALDTFAARGGRVVFRHHDLPWQPGWWSRDGAGAELPPRTPGALHSTVSLRARRELHARSYEPIDVIHDHFDFDAPVGERAAVRTAHGFADDELVLYQPTAATTHTNVAGAVRFAGALHAAMPKQSLRYWLRGPVDPTVAPVVDRLLQRCAVAVTIGASAPARDALAASDVALVPSTWDSSGGSAIAAIAAGRPCVVGSFPVRGELEAVGLRFYGLDDAVELMKFLARPNEQQLAANLRRARLSFAVADLPGRIAAALAAIGITT